MTKQPLFKLIPLVILAFTITCCKPIIDVRSEALTALQRTHEIALSLVDKELSTTGMKLADVAERTAKLDQLLAQPQQWIEEQKKIDYDVPCG